MHSSWLTLIMKLWARIAESLVSVCGGGGAAAVDAEDDVVVPEADESGARHMDHVV